MDKQSMGETGMGMGMAPQMGVPSIGQPMQPPPEAPPEEAPPEGGGAEGEATDATHHSQMLGVQREIELAKKRQELAKIQQQTMEGMVPGGGGPAGGGDPAAAGGDPAAAGGGDPAAGAMAGPAGGEAELPSPVAGPPQEEIPEPHSGPMVAPPGGGMPKQGAAELTKQAMQYTKMGRPQSHLVSQDLARATGLDAVKTAMAKRNDEIAYPMANPHGGLIRDKTKLAMLLDEAVDAVSVNQQLHKQACDIFQKSLGDYMYEGGNLAEAGMLMVHVSSDAPVVKVAMEASMPYLVSRGLDLVKAQADALNYQMEKGASAREPNFNHPIAESFANTIKLASGQIELNAVLENLKAKYAAADNALKQAARNSL